MEKKPEIEKSKDHPLVPHSNLTIAQQDAILDEWPLIFEVLKDGAAIGERPCFDIIIRLSERGVK